MDNALSPAEQARAILENAYDELYNAIVKGTFPEWYVKGLPDYEKNGFDNGEPRDTIPRFMEILGLKMGEALLSQRGNALSVLAADSSLKKYAALLFDLTHSDPRFAGELHYPIYAEACHELLHNALGADMRNLDPLFLDAFGKGYSRDYRDKSPGSIKIESAISNIIHQAKTVEEVAAGRLTTVNGERRFVAKKDHPRIGKSGEGHPRIHRDLPGDGVGL